MCDGYDIAVGSIEQWLDDMDPRLNSDLLSELEESCKTPTPSPSPTSDCWEQCVPLSPTIPPVPSPTTTTSQTGTLVS